MRDLQEYTDEFIRQAELAGDIPIDAGIAAALIHDRRVILRVTRGLADRERGLPVTGSTKFEIGSLTKSFTATAMLLAQQEGHVDLDEAINEDGPLLRLRDPGTMAQVSIADVLSHRTGLVANDLLWYFSPTFSADALLDAVRLTDSVPGAFRHTFIYNNLTYAALGHLFEAWAGLDWWSYIDRRILTPLAMTSTVLGLTDEPPDAAQPYVGRCRVPRANTASVAAAGAMASTLDDLSRWAATWLQIMSGTGSPIAAPGTLEKAHAPHINAQGGNPYLFHGLEWLGDTVHYGYGWLLGTFAGAPAAYHPGFIDGYSSVIVVVPRQAIAAVVMTNVNLSSFPGLLTQELFRYVLGGAGTISSPAPDALAAGRVAGTYENPLFGRITIAATARGTILTYKGRSWCLSWTTPHTAVFSMSAFGLTIPCSVDCEVDPTGEESLIIPLSLDPRVTPQRFRRVRD